MLCVCKWAKLSEIDKIVWVSKERIGPLQISDGPIEYNSHNVGPVTFVSVIFAAAVVELPRQAPQSVGLDAAWLDAKT